MIVQSHYPPLTTPTMHEELALTEIEVMGLASTHDLANGHASQELAPSQQRIIEMLPEIWTRAASQKSRAAELMFKDAFAKLANARSLSTYESFKICPTASNSIDTVATWLAAKQLRTALIEPTFDNLYLILKRRGVDITSLPEHFLHEFSLQSTINTQELLSNVDALFLVNPNNPTGQVLSKQQFAAIAEWCAINNKVVILDNTFRFFVPQTYDTYQILLDSGVTFLSIEDTGKVWPTQEIKASLLFTSPAVFREIDIIYDEIFLCHSNFALGILSEFLLDAYTRGLPEAVWKDVASRRQQFRAALDGSILDINAASLSSTISVEWVTIKEQFRNDIELVEYFNTKGLVVLPGRQFYWSKSASTMKTNFARFALLKPKEQFLSSLQILATELKRLHA